MASFAPKLTRRERDATRHKLAKGRADQAVGMLCAITRAAMAEGRILTPLSYEALFRQVIRSQLCLQGWRWHPADQVACDLVGVVLSILQAKRPTWEEGQREFVSYGGRLIQRTRCVKCHAPLADEQIKFCSSLCASSYHKRITSLKEAQDGEAATLAARSEI
jgi:hypothetical protein